MSARSFVAGLILLFAVYHFPEFFPSFWITAVFKIGFLFVALVLSFSQGLKGLGAYGLTISKQAFKNIFIGLLIGCTCYGISFFVSTQLDYEQVISSEKLSVLLTQLPMLMFFTLVPSLAEDILTRGYLWAFLQGKTSKASWLLISAAFFVLNHIWRLNEGLHVLAYLFSLGLVLALCVYKTKSLWLAFGIHWGANLAFESMKALFTTKEITVHNEATWLLAFIWTVLFGLFMIQQSKKEKENSNHTL